MAAAQTLLGSYRCECHSGYTGRLCDLELDECASSPCQYGGVCHNAVNGYRCECPQGTSGKIQKGVRPQKLFLNQSLVGLDILEGMEDPPVGGAAILNF